MVTQGIPVTNAHRLLVAAFPAAGRAEYSAVYSFPCFAAGAQLCAALLAAALY